MRGSHTPGVTELDVSDSLDRLGWVDTLVSRALPVVEGINAQSRNGDVAVETAEAGAWGYARYLLMEAIPVPDELGFLIADIAVNARSCLDMATTAAATAYGSPNLKPYFPTEQNMTTQTTKKLFKTLPAEFKEVFTELQPRYETPWGRFDVPINRTALMISEVSNTNKHRNLTPAVRLNTSSGFSGESIGVEVAGGPDRHWGPDDVTLLEVRYPRGTVTVEDLTSVRLLCVQELALANVELQYLHPGFPVPILLGEFLRLAPSYVRYALKLMGQAHRQAQSAQPGPWHEINLDL